MATFYEPCHGGEIGVKPLPEPLRLAALRLDGKMMSLEKGLNLLREAVGDSSMTIEVRRSDLGNWVAANQCKGTINHTWRLIRFRD